MIFSASNILLLAGGSSVLKLSVRSILDDSLFIFIIKGSIIRTTLLSGDEELEALLDQFFTLVKAHHWSYNFA